MRGILLVAIVLLTALPASAGIPGLENDIKPVAPRAADTRLSRSASPAPDQTPLELKMIRSLNPAAVAGKSGRYRQLLLWAMRPKSGEVALAETLLTILQATLALITLVILALLTYTTVVRLRRQSQERERKQFRDRWEVLLYRRMVGESISLPEIAPSERLPLLTLLIETVAIVRGDAASEVASVARERGLTSFVLALLASRSRWKREIGIRGAGALRLAEAVRPLEHLVASERRFTSLSAASALVKIDANRGFAALVPVLQRIDWSTERIAGLITSANCPPARLVSSLLESAPPQRLKQVIRMIEFLGERSMLPELRSRIARSNDPELIAAILRALRSLGDAEDRSVVVNHMNHANALVRMQAAHALGGLGSAEDADVLMPLLRDPNWWVRYRAAQSLLALAGKEKARAAAVGESDAYAREILQRVLAEQG